MHHLGLALQVVGAVITVAGFHISRRQLFPESGGLWGLGHLTRWSSASWRRLKRLLWKLRKRTPPAPNDVAVSIRVSIGASGRVHAPVTPAEPTLDDRVRILDEQLTQLRAQNVAEHQAMRHDHDALNVRIGEIDAALHDAKRELVKISAEHVGGHSGRGLNIAALGVLIGAVGTVFAG